MFTIIKNQQPSGLIQYRKQKDASYNEIKRELKSAIRLSLLKEQNSLCAYCMCRIKNKREETKIEHIEPQSKSPDKMLDYKNMLAVCSGGEGSPYDQQHCDTYKGDKLLSFNPADTRVNLEIKLRYNGSGEIHSDDEQLNSDINEILNLNVVSLKENRHAVFLGIIRELSRSQKHAKKTDILRLIAKWKVFDKEGKRKPYFAAAVYFLNKRLQKCSS